MKKILNDPFKYVDEMLEGMCLAHPELYRQTGESGRVIARASDTGEGKVGIVSGGGSGHLPIFTGYVGKGLLDACAIGDVFASPSVEQMADAMRAADGGAAPLRRGPRPAALRESLQCDGGYAGPACARPDLQPPRPCVRACCGRVGRQCHRD